MKNKDEKKIMVTSLVLLIVVLWTGNSATWAQPADPEEYQESATPEGYVLVEEDVLMMFTEAPGEQFHRANELFKAGQFKQCAEHIRRGAAYLKLQQARADIQGRRELEGAVKALDKLAQDVEFGKVNEASRLESAFARAHHALARHHKIKAERYQRQEAKDKLVKAMKAAGSHLESGFKWTGRQLDGGTRTVIRETKELPGEVIGGIGWTTEKIGEGIGKLGAGISKLGRIINPSRTSVGSSPDPSEDDYDAR